MKLQEELSIPLCLKKMSWSTGINTRNAHSETAERLDKKSGQWCFSLCLIKLLKIWFLRKICTLCVLSCPVAWWLVHSFLRKCPWILFRLMSSKIWPKLHWIRDLIPRKKLTIIGLTILPWWKQELPSYHDVVVCCRSPLKSKPHSLISLHWKFELHVYQSFREK